MSKGREFIERNFEKMSEKEIVDLVEGYSRVKPTSVKKTVKCLLREELLKERGSKEEILRALLLLINPSKSVLFSSKRKF